MTQAIKFRAWIMDVDPPLMTYDIDTLAFDECGVYYNTSMFSDHFILMQFTGLLDKEGNEIYEGDIVEDPSGRHFRIIFHHGMFRMNDGQGADSRITHRIVRILGNPHEHPELTKDSTDN
jgi:hypothetical protein